jgi:glycosyltransferase involved in cell wall biosynthesis
MGKSAARQEGESIMKSMISIVAPVYNEAKVIEQFAERVYAAITPLADRYSFELILVNDGSRDDSLAIMKRMTSRFDSLRVIELRRNYGQTPALQAGLDAARGEIMITMDADLQHFPEEIPAFVARLEQGYDMVCGWRNKRKEGIVRSWPSKVANKLLLLISGLDIHDFGTTFRAYRSELTRELRLFGESHRYIPILGSVAGARITEIPIKNIERPQGRSNYGLGRTLGVTLDLILVYFLVHYMDRPLRAFGKLGTLLGLTGAGIMAVLVVYGYRYNVASVREHSGWFLVSVMLLLSSLQIILVGILAEILIRVHYSLGGHQVYNVRREWNSSDAESSKCAES